MKIMELTRRQETLLKSAKAYVFGCTYPIPEVDHMHVFKEKDEVELVTNFPHSVSKFSDREDFILGLIEKIAELRKNGVYTPVIEFSNEDLFSTHFLRFVDSEIFNNPRI